MNSTIVLSLLSTLTIASPARGAEIWLGVGGTRVIPAARGVPIRVGVRGVVRVIDVGRAVRIVALKVGATTLSAGDQTYAVRVTSERQHEFVNDLRLTLATMRGLSLELDGGRPEITGTLLRFSDWQVIADLARRHRGEYGFRAQARREVGEAAIRHLTAVTLARGYPLVRFTADPEFTAILPGSAKTLAVVVERALAAYGVRARAAEGELDAQPLVKTRIVLAEVTRGFERTLGLHWPAEYTGQVLPQPHADGKLLASLRALEASGHAQILAAPELACRSGGAAQFHAGGEIPIRVSTRNSGGVTWKRFGVLLNIRPRADYQGSISLDVKTEISRVDFSHPVDGLPSIKTNVVESQFDLTGHRTVALAGLMKRESDANVDGLPFLSSIPILGRLFSSRQYRDNRSDLVIFVTPEIVGPDAGDEPKMPPGWSTDAD